MAGTSNVVAKSGVEKIHEKVAEKRRALGRGLESLLPGPRVVKPAPEAAGTDTKLQRTESTSGAAEHASSQGSPLSVSSSAPAEGSAAATTTATASTPTAASATRSGSAPALAPAAGSAGSSSFSAATSSSSPDSSFSPSSSPSSVSPSASDAVAIDSSVGSGATRASIASPATVDLEASAEGISPGGSVGAQATEVIRLEIARIDDNPYQTRMFFDEKALMELAQSIRVQGVLQPIVVRPGEKGYFKLILGERRLRAARLAGMEAIPAIIKRVSEQQAAEMTVVENLQRQDLNCVDQAAAFANLSTQFKLTQEQIGARVGLSRETVSNYMRLLTLSDGIIGALQKGTLSYSHARALLMVQDTAHRWTLAKRVMEEKMSVARLEALVQGMEFPRESKEAKEGGARWVDPNVKAAQRSLEEVLGMRVRIRDRQGRGRILIDYSTLEDFDRVVKMLKGR